MGKKSKSSTAGSSSAADDAKHEAQLQAVILADPFSDTFRPTSFDRCAPMLCPLNNVILLDYTMDFCAGAGVEELFVVCVDELVEKHVNAWQQTNSAMMSVTVVRDPSLTNAGDALRELDRRDLVQSDPFLLLRGDVVANVDLQRVLQEHKERHKQDSSAIMTLLFKPVSPWNVTTPPQQDDNKGVTTKPKATYSTLRSSTEDLVVGLDTSTTVAGHAPRIFVYDDQPSQSAIKVPCSFLTACPNLDFRCDLLDCGIDICSPDVLARFSDAFDYRDIRREFVADSVAEEEEGLQQKLYAHILQPHEYAARVQDWRTYSAVSYDLLRRWCYPIVPDNLPSGYEKQFRYVQQRSHVYREQKLGRTRVGRSSVIKGGGMIGSHCFIGENCVIQGTVIGNHCHIADNVTLTNCHVWDGVSIEQGATAVNSILAYECVVKAGAKVSKGCVVGEGCIIGANMKLPTFSRITTVSKDAEGSDDDSDEFDDSDEDDEEEEGTATKAKTGSSGGGGDGGKDEVAVETDHHIVGKDGRGRLWLPSVDDDDDSDDDDDEGDQSALLAKINEMKSRSIGFDPTNLYSERKKEQESAQQDDGYSDNEADNDATMRMDEVVDDGVAFGTADTQTDGASETPTYGRQAGVDVVQELKNICLEFEPGSPMENLAIELNSYKFSQNATYSDCAMGATLAVLDLMQITPGMTPGRLVGALKSQLEVWAPLLKRLCIGTEEEKAIIVALENTAIGGGDIGTVLGVGPSFRFVLQTLHDEEVIGEDPVLTWASERRTEIARGDDNARIQLFQQQPVQDFLEWLEGESEEDDDDEDDEEDESE
ncbi:factor eIF-2B subunit epsilon [Seminavis robusta]|uniref:Translation initiation factor eIF2B subunit epsilon n=1 Tax=Seminavis robusta TaxID=568900 RepID=A0A9N8DG49_9STRA|nr:factor eIF-2B subunit epsilon [Seminavis robusta]|eukprot:Sro125_g060220.1 factor eIF-2B subunit epsilon (822) ;mRNA; f:55308-57773